MLTFDGDGDVDAPHSLVLILDFLIIVPLISEYKFNVTVVEILRLGFV